MVEQKLKAFIYPLCLHFYSVGSLSFLADEQNLQPTIYNIFTTLPDHFRSSLSENIASC